MIGAGTLRRSSLVLPASASPIGTVCFYCFDDLPMEGGGSRGECRNPVHHPSGAMMPVSNDSRLVEAAIAPRDRIDAIDSLRGLALFGVLAVNLLTEYRTVYPSAGGSLVDALGTWRPRSAGEQQAHHLIKPSIIVPRTWTLTRRSTRFPWLEGGGADVR